MVLHVLGLLSLQQVLLQVPMVHAHQPQQQQQQQQQQLTSMQDALQTPPASSGSVSHHFVAVVLMPTHSPSMDLMTAAAHLLAR
jgi:hypothetical protein